MTILILFIIALLLTAFSSGTETAFSAASRLKAYTRMRRRERGSRLTLKYLEQPSLFLITTLVGTNVGMVLSSSIVAHWASESGIAWVEPVAVTALAFFVLIFAELIPKQYMHLTADRNVNRLALPLRFLRIILYPIIIIAGLFTHIIAGGRQKLELLTGRKEIYGLISTIQGDFGKLAGRILDLNATEVNKIALSLNSMSGVRMNISPEALFREAEKCNSPFIIVYENDGKRLRGYINKPDIIRAFGVLRDDVVEGFPYFDRNSVLMNVVSALWKADSPAGVVIGDRGQPVGIVILDDIIDFLLGEPEKLTRVQKITDFYWKDGKAAIR